jgi:hypothetical protein
VIEFQFKAIKPTKTMSFFGKLFSGKKGEPQPTPSEAIQKLRDIENMLTKKQDFLEKKIELELDSARKNGTKNKRGKSPFSPGQQAHTVL